MTQRIKVLFFITAIVTLFVAIFMAHLSDIADASSVSATAVDAKAIFDSKCAKCHGKDGRAKTFRGKLKHARDFTDAAWQDGVSDERLFNSITNGKGKMPSFKKNFSEEQIDALVAYVRRLKK